MDGKGSSSKVIPITRKPMGRAGTEMLEICRDRVFTDWLTGQPERRLADVYQRPRRVIEAIVRERAQARLWPGPAQEKKAA